MSKKKTPKPTPTLLESQSAGGETAQKGFVFQDGVLLSQLPRWLANEGFTALTRESIGDTEVKFFVPGRGSVIDLWEAKDHHLTPAEFWSEVARFKEIYAGSSNTYCSFTLASVGLSDALQSIERALRRIRNSYDFYEPHSAVIQNSYQEYEQRVKDAGHEDEDARFLFDRVFILPDFAATRHNAESFFRQGVDEYLPDFRELTNRETGTLFSHLKSLIGPRLNSPISRKEIEAAISEALGERCPPERPISICTTTDIERRNGTDLCFDWAAFFGGENRNYPPADDWNTRLLGELRETFAWILENRSTRRIRVTGSRRLSAALAIGSVFSAVSGFAIDMVYRSETWSTDAHAKATTSPYEFTRTESLGKGADLVVIVGIGRDILTDVQAALPTLALAQAPLLHLHSVSPVQSPEHANVAVTQLKQVISAQLTKTAAAKAHLFFSGPSHVALFLGHRLNATAPVQCYEWTGCTDYVPTCLLYDNA